MTAAVAGGVASVLLGPLEGCARSGYSLVQYMKHSWRSYDNYEDFQLTDTDTNSPYATLKEVKNAYWQQFLRGLSEIVLPIIATLGWLFSDSQQDLDTAHVCNHEGSSWFHHASHMMQGPQMRKLHKCEEVIDQMIADLATV